jgi:hypothetical protein
VKLHSIFLRGGCILPDGIELIQNQYCAKWMSVQDTMPLFLTRKIRNVGWRFLGLQDLYSHFAVARTEESAASKAIAFSLCEVKVTFNGAELESANVRNYLVLRIARVTFHARQIHRRRSATLELAKSANDVAAS